MSQLSPVNVFNLAQQFLDAAQREFQHAGPNVVSLPAHFLVARSIELALKSFLLLKGASIRDLKAVGHNLDKGLEAAAISGLASVVVLQPEEEAAVQMLNPYYVAKDLEYVTTGYKRYPQAEFLLSCANRILVELWPHIRTWRPSA